MASMEEIESHQNSRGWYPWISYTARSYRVWSVSKKIDNSVNESSPNDLVSGQLRAAPKKRDNPSYQIIYENTVQRDRDRGRVKGVTTLNFQIKQHLENISLISQFQQRTSVLVSISSMTHKPSKKQYMSIRAKSGL